MIGIFDSGSGGLSFLDECRKVLPEYDYIYFGDYKNCPYGNRQKSEIVDLTRAGVLRLKNAGAKIVILACNTATWAAIRELQSEEKILGVKVLGVTIPGAEAVLENNFKKIAVFATQASANNNLYKNRVHILDNSVSVTEIGMPTLALHIEHFLSWEKTEQDIIEEISQKKDYIESDTQAIILGCTHYSLVENMFTKIFPNQVTICPSRESAKKLKKYLQKHTEIDKNLSKNGEVRDISER